MGVHTNGARRRGRMVSEINVTPLVDVVLVLLIVFMISAPLLQSGIEVDLFRPDDELKRLAQVAVDQGVADTIKNGGEFSHTFAFDPNAPVTAEGFTAEDQQGMVGGPDGGEGGEGGMPVYPFIVGGITGRAQLHVPHDARGEVAEPRPDEWAGPHRRGHQVLPRARRHR